MEKNKENKRRSVDKVNNSTEKRRNSRRTQNSSNLRKEIKEKMSRNDEIDIDLSNIENAMVAVNTDVNKPVAVKNTKPTIFAKPKLKIIPLGGMNEIGKNITVFEYANEIIVVDCGLAFPEDDMLGVDLVIPDTTY